MAISKMTILDIGSFYTKIKASWNSDILIAPTLVCRDNLNQKYYFSDEAMSIYGKENQNVDTIFPIKGGKIQDKDSMIDFLAYLLTQIGYDKKRKEPICIMSAPNLSQHDYILLKETLRETRWMSKDIYIYPQPLSDLMSFSYQLNHQPMELVIHIGHYMTHISAISYGQVVRSINIEKGLRSLYIYIHSQILEEYQLDVSLIDIQRALLELETLYFHNIHHLPFYGINLTSELPLRMNIESFVFEESINRYMQDIQSATYQLLKRLPHHMYDMTLVRGACLTGGGAMFKGCSQLLSNSLGFDVQAHPLSNKTTLLGFDLNQNRLLAQPRSIDDMILNVSR